jgi:hypothetical protein
MLTRRDLLKIGGIALAARTGAQVAQSPTDGATTEQQKGDPDTSYEHITFNRTQLNDLVSNEKKAVFEPPKRYFSEALLENAQKFVGCSRATSPGQIQEFLRLYGLPFQDASGYIAFCAAGIGYCAAMAYAELLGIIYKESDRLARFRALLRDIEHWYYYPTVSCIDIFYIAAGKHRWVDHTAQNSPLPKPGWIVLFDRTKSGRADHCGIVSRATREKLFTVEFNTSGTAGGSQRNGGVVAEREREYGDYVKGYVVTSLPSGSPN